MLWINPKRPHDKSVKPKRFSIKPGSILDVPRSVRAGVKNFEGGMDEYFHKQANDIHLLVGLSEIYEAYKKDGVIDVQSTQGKILKERHEKFVIDFLKEHVESLENFSSYVQ